MCEQEMETIDQAAENTSETASEKREKKKKCMWWEKDVEAEQKRLVSPLADFHQEGRVGRREVGEKFKVHRGAQVVRVGDEHVLHALRQQLSDAKNNSISRRGSLASLILSLQTSLRLGERTSVENLTADSSGNKISSSPTADSSQGC